MEAVRPEVMDRERELGIMRRVMKKWWRVAGLEGHPGLADTEEFSTVHWTKVRFFSLGLSERNQADR